MPSRSASPILTGESAHWRVFTALDDPRNWCLEFVPTEQPSGFQPDALPLSYPSLRSATKITESPILTSILSSVSSISKVSSRA